VCYSSFRYFTKTFTNLINALLRYLFKRLLIFVPTLWVISILIFVLSRYAPGDPVTMMLGANDETSSNGSASVASRQKMERELTHELGMDLPLFYLSLSTAAYPDTFYKASTNVAARNTLSRMIDKYGNWTTINTYHQRLNKLNDTLRVFTPADVSTNTFIQIRANVNELLLTYEDVKIKFLLQKIGSDIVSAPDFRALQPLHEALNDAYTEVNNQPIVWLNYIPKINWYGFQNQYHQWFVKFIRFDFGISYQDKRPISASISERIGWTMLISGLSILIIYLIAIPLGVYSAQYRNSRRNSVITTFLFFLYSLPNFWVATMLIVFFCQPDYLDWFPAYGLSDKTIANDGIFTTFADQAWHLILPVFCISYSGLAFLARQMRTAVIHNLKQDYIRTARAKGVSNRTIIWKHALRNSLLPIITQLAAILPNLIGGSIFMEQIFTIPGMGNRFYDAIQYKDYPVVFTIVMLTACLTVIGYLISDILYAYADPRIRFK
jgi:peptide/nickel transport system permease protein